MVCSVCHAILPTSLGNEQESRYLSDVIDEKLMAQEIFKVERSLWS